LGNKIKFGIAGPVPGQAVKDLIEFTVNAENKGFDSIWFPDHIVFMAQKLNPDVWSVITAASLKTDSILMGAIGDAHRMHPAVFAQRLATIDHLSEGRTFACLGYGEKMNLDPYDIKWDKPLKRVEESVKIMRSLWIGDSVDFNGDIYNLNQAELRIQPLNGKVPLYIAATGPKALEVAGKYGDGWLSITMPTQLFKKKAKIVNNFVTIDNESKDDFENCIYIFISLANDQDEAFKSLEPVKHALIWPELLKEAGYDIKIDEEYSGLQYTKIMPNDPDMLRKFKEMGQKYYSKEILMDFVIAGSKEQVTKRIEEYIEAGVNHFIFRDFSPDKEYSFKTLTTEIMPYFRK